MTEIPVNFRGYAGEPTSEQEVVFLFGLLFDEIELPLVVTSVGIAFPDCRCIDPTSKKSVSIEFELRSSSFQAHKHPKNGCDYIVCWEHDWPGAAIPVICLKDFVKKKNLEGRRFLTIPRPGTLWERLEILNDGSHPEYAAVKHFLDVSLPRLQDSFPELSYKAAETLDLKHHEHGYLIAVKPSGQLYCGSIERMVQEHGKRTQPAATRLRSVYERIKVLRTVKEAEEIETALREFLVLTEYNGS